MSRRADSAGRSRSGSAGYRSRSYGRSGATRSGPRRSYGASGSSGRYGQSGTDWSSRQARNFQALQISATKPATRSGVPAYAVVSYGQGAGGRPSRPSSAHVTTRGAVGSAAQARVRSYSRPVSAPRTRMATGYSRGSATAQSSAAATHAVGGRPPTQPIKAFGSTSGSASNGAAVKRGVGDSRAADRADDEVAQAVATATAAVSGNGTPKASASKPPAGSGKPEPTAPTSASGGSERRTYTPGGWAGSDATKAQRSRPSSATAYRSATQRGARPQSARPVKSGSGEGDGRVPIQRQRPTSATTRQRPGSASGAYSRGRTHGDSGAHSYGFNAGTQRSGHRPGSAKGSAQRPGSAKGNGAWANSYVQQYAAAYGHSPYTRVGSRPQSAQGYGGTASRPSSSGAYGAGRAAAAALRNGQVHSNGGSSASQASSAATSDATTLDEEARAQHEWQQRQRLKRLVASPSFDGRATTDFYKFGKVLGQGSFGKVRLAAHRLSGVRVAVKSYEKAKLQNPSHWRRAQQEIALMERMNHPHIIRMLECIESPKRVHIVMEYAGGSNLCQYVKAKRRLAEPEARAIFCQVMLATEYLHNVGIIHRDIKLENVLFDDNRQMKLVDFGFSVGCRDPTKKLKIFCGTPSYMAPEIVMRREYLGRPVDVWSLGVLLYAMLCGVFPFVAKSYPELYKKIVQAQLRLPDHLSHAVKDLLARMLCPDVSKRIGLAQVRRHAWTAAAASVAVRNVRTPAHHSFMISEDPADDLDERSLAKCEEMCFNREQLIKAVLSRVRNHFTTVYYLVLFRLGRSNVPDRGRVPASGSPADFSRAHRPASASASRSASAAAATQRQRPSSAAPTAGRTREAQRAVAAAEVAAVDAGDTADSSPRETKEDAEPDGSDSKGESAAKTSSGAAFVGTSGPVAARHDLGLANKEGVPPVAPTETAGGARSPGVAAWTGVRSSGRRPDTSSSLTSSAGGDSTSSSPPGGSAASGPSSVTLSPGRGSTSEGSASKALGPSASGAPKVLMPASEGDSLSAAE